MNANDQKFVIEMMMMIFMKIKKVQGELIDVKFSVLVVVLEFWLGSGAGGKRSVKNLELIDFVSVLEGKDEQASAEAN